MIWRPPPPPFPFDGDISEIADWAELTVAATGSSVGRGKVQTTMAREDAGDASRVADVWSELRRRDSLFGPNWPFRLTLNVLSPRRPTTMFSLHVFLAALGMRTNIDFEGRELFEHAVAEILQGLVGPQTMRLGAPRRAPVPASLTDAVKEYFGSATEDAAILRPFPTSDGDLGLDVAGWMTFDDDRGGFLHFIGQCATGADWRDKLLELNPHKWNDHVNWSVPPVRFFALPFVVKREEFRRTSLDGGLILDRPRLVHLAAKAPVSTSLRRKLQNYCSTLYGS